MKITIEREGAETKAIETDNAIILVSDGENGIATDMCITAASAGMLCGFADGLKASLDKIISECPPVPLYLMGKTR